MRVGTDPRLCQLKYLCLRDPAKFSGVPAQGHRDFSLIFYAPADLTQNSLHFPHILYVILRKSVLQYDIYRPVFSNGNTLLYVEGREVFFIYSVDYFGL
jgi:hypothetical protein